MLLATTNQMCQQLAVVPFLWVLPLVLYLGSYILCFRRSGNPSRGVWSIALVAASALACVSLSVGPTQGILLEIGSQSFSLLAACMVCHGELARSKPVPGYLTHFYLSIGLGGALGGFFVGLLAPALFSGVWEYPVGLWIAGLLLVVMARRDKGSWIYRTRPWLPFTVVTGVLLALLGIQVTLRLTAKKAPPEALFLLTILALALGIALVLWKRRSKERFARPTTMLGFGSASLLVLGMVLFAIEIKNVRGLITRRRNFYGTLVVVEKNRGDSSNRVLELKHGRVLHGRQFLDSSKRRWATSYYGPTSGAGLAVLYHPRRKSADPSLRIGVVGLGVGTLAAYCKPGDSIRFYEINPDVLRLSEESSNLFTYLKDCEGRVEVELGDARLNLERELGVGQRQEFDVLVIDAFSGDAIPVHLLAKEAFAVYLEHLRDPGGVIAVHISNGFLNLSPVVRGLADHFDLRSALIRSSGDEPLCAPSTWVLVRRGGEPFEAPEIKSNASPFASRPPPRLWTDQYSNLFSVLKW